MENLHLRLAISLPGIARRRSWRSAMLPSRCLASFALCMLLSAFFAPSSNQVAAEDKNLSPWPAPVAGFKAPQSGDHPRLFFRKSELPEIRKRAGTAEGKVIVERLKQLLGGGEQMPTEFNPNRGK